MPRRERDCEGAAAPAAVPFNTAWIDASKPVAPASAAILATQEQFPNVRWVLNDGEDIVRKADIDAVEHCTEVLFHLRKVAEKARNEIIVLEAEEVVKVLSCSA